MGTAPRLYRLGYGGDRAAHRELEERRPEIITRIFRGRSRDIANFRATVINCGFSGSSLMLKFPLLPLWSIAYDPFNRADRKRRRSNHLSCVNNFGHLGTAFTETDVERADLETVITDLMSGQYSDPVRVVAFNTAEHWADDVSQDVALEILRRVDELPSSIEAFIEMHAGPSRQLSLRLN